MTHDNRTALALDLGTTLGWAACSPNGNVTSGTVNFKNRRFEGGGMRYLRFNNWLAEIDALFLRGIGVVYFEEVRAHRGTDAAHVYGGLMSILTSWCEAKKIPYEGIPIGTIKRFATGRGDAPKDNVDLAKRNAKAKASGRALYPGKSMTAAVQSWGYNPHDNNETDALALLHCKIGFPKRKKYRRRRVKL